MKIIISCATGLKNSGDEAMLGSVLDQLAKNLNYDIKVFSFDPEFTRKFHEVETISHSILKHPLSFIKTIKECDLFILGPGGLLQDKTSLGNVPFWLSKLFVALALGKKTFIYANGVGPINLSINKLLIRTALNRVNMITVRDRRSREILEGLGVKQPVQVTADSAFALKPPGAKTTQLILKKAKIEDKYVLVFLRHWFDTHPLIPVKYCVKYDLKNKKNKLKWNDLITKFVKVVNWINEELDLDVIFLAMCPNRDNKAANAILEKVKNKTRNKSLNDFYKPQEIIGMIKHSELVIGMRLHSIIYSITAEKPFISLAYSQKVWGLLGDASMRGNGVDIENFTSNQVISLIKKTLKNYSEEKERIKAFLKKSRKAEQKNIIYLKRLLSNTKNKQLI